MYKYRYLQSFLKETNAQMGALMLVGPRRAGKSTLAKRLLQEWGYAQTNDQFNGYHNQRYISFDTPDVVARFQNDPVIFMQNLEFPCVLDEVQNVPEIFKYIKADLDKNFKKKIRFILTGSQQYNMMSGASESLAGRVLIKELHPFSQAEIGETTINTFRTRFDALLENPKELEPLPPVKNLDKRILTGGFPPLFEIETEVDRRDWIRSYVQTYIQRDIRQMSAIHDLGTFNRYLSLIAGKSGKVINHSELGKELGINYKTSQHYTSLLEAGFLWQTVPPYYKNTEKRITKSAKGILRDSGLHCFLTGIFNSESLSSSPLLGSVFESFCISELLKLNSGLNLDAQFYYFDQASKYEVDLIMEHNSKKFLFEFKHSATFSSSFLDGFKKFKQAYPKEKVEKSFLISQNPEINLVGDRVWTIPIQIFF